MRRYRTLQPHVEKLDATLAEKEELRELLLSEEVGRRQTKPPTVPRNSGSCNHPSFCFKEDGDFAEAVKNDLKALDAKITQIAEDVVPDLLPREAYDASDAVLEVVPGAGGGEAGIFAQEIFDLYTEYTRHLGFEVAVVEYSENTVKGSVRGITKAVAHVGGRGRGVFKMLKFETGVHRVQRVPVNSTQIHTSTCSVAVLPRPDLESFPLPNAELKYEFTRGSGPGGQNINTSESACRVVHLPTGTMVLCQEKKSAAQNKSIATERLRTILYQRKFSAELAKVNSSRRSQIGNMDRNEKVRTYNAARNMVTDHRIGESRTLNLGQFFSGQSGFALLEDFREILTRADEKERLMALLTSTSES